MTGSEKRKANALQKIIDDRQVSLDEAIEIYKDRFRLLGKIGGSKSTVNTGFALMDKEKRQQVSKMGVKARRGENQN